jgi:L-lactate dehydrogenase complex protein LldG
VVEEAKLMSAREDVLRRVREALGDRAAPPAVPRGYLRSLGDLDVVELFAERAADYRATVARVSVAELPGAIAEALRERGAHRIVVPPGLPPEWLSEAGIEPLADEPPLGVRELDRSDGVVSGSAVAIALTGTIILDGGPAQGRRALTLLPDYHLCVVRTDQIVGTVSEALTRLDPSRPQTWISGPSATSDIELNRVEGVHGPRTLHILIVD